MEMEVGMLGEVMEAEVEAVEEAVVSVGVEEVMVVEICNMTRVTTTMVGLKHHLLKAVVSSYVHELSHFNNSNEVSFFFPL